jgi:hypothetical protein
MGVMLSPRFIADAIVCLHAAYVAFVVLGLAAILVGAMLRWNWIRNFWFRVVHLAAIVLVGIEAIFGVMCPLTLWESEFREAAGESVHQGSFLGHWLHELIYLDVPNWLISTGHCLFAVAVIVAFVGIPPRWPRR